MRSIFYLLTLAALLNGCDKIEEALDISDKESTGTCYAEPEMLTEIGTVYPQLTHFYRDDQHNLVEHAFVDINVKSSETGSEILVVDAHFSDMPSKDVKGSHPLLGPGYVDQWDVLVPENAVVVGDSFTIDSANREFVKGVFTIDFQHHASITCDISLGRKYSLDTDD